jgi:hypothetical protein
MQCILHGAGLGPEYWSFALQHVTYIYNRLPHSATGMTPHYALTGKQPTTENFRVFGCKVFVKRASKRPQKLDYHKTTVIFLGFIPTPKNIYYIDRTTRKIKMATHITFDEAHYTNEAQLRPPAAQALINLGFKEEEDIAVHYQVNTSHQPSQTPQVQLLSFSLRLPQQCSEQAVGYDVSSTMKCSLEPHNITEIPLNITIAPPPGTYTHILPRSSLARKGVTIFAGITTQTTEST